MSTGTNEASHLVSWDDPEELGKIPNSEWVCPTGSLDRVAALELSGRHVRITDDDIRELAEGRTQHAALARFPEGYHAVRIVDSETGAVLTGPGYDHRYDRTQRDDCVCGRCVPGTPIVTSFMNGSPIPLGDGKEVGHVHNLNGGTSTVIKPTKVDALDPDYLSRRRARARVTPQSQELYIATEGEVGAMQGVDLKIIVREQAARVTGELIMWLNAERGESGQINAELGSDGQIRQLRVCQGGLLKAIGLNHSLDFSGGNDWKEIRDWRQRQRILDATAEVLDLGDQWQGLELRATASNLYAAMGQRNLDPSTVLVPRS